MNLDEHNNKRKLAITPELKRQLFCGNVKVLPKYQSEKANKTCCSNLPVT